MTAIGEFLVFGAVLGSILALLASGYSLVYGVGGISNLAHGAFYILTGYMIYWFYNSGIVTYPVAIICGLILITLVGAVTYLGLIKHAQHHEIAVMIITFALAFLIEQGILVYEGTVPGEVLPISLPPFIPGGIDFFGTQVTYQNIIILISTVVIISSLILFIKKSKLGKSIRAVSQDLDAAKLMGINVNRVLMITVAVSSFLAGIAAALYVPVRSILPFSGWDYLILSMSVVILGGLGSIYGSVLGAFIIAFAQSFTFIFIDLQFQTAFSGIIPVATIIIMLMIRPKGIFGKKERT